ncbi:hypothetical protein G1H11_21790 [Phytoactinopolyspora alkaliphila]|uniref:DUF222 domain-containing protein n=1 Tax=Phytoactinopolyspora alkaliphila TaxID=1783498 RepID=A0A6N9YSK5_9ACTN|nr:hypothetical protein [Phytoactinopolyspora alkaliphila]NED97935.1 hypothetical protein [Phytoactinopolyspora alkaliphila]
MRETTNSHVGDVCSNDGLRAALRRMPADGGWDGPTGRAVIDALRSVARRWISPYGAIEDPHRADHLAGLAWEFLKTDAESVLRARSPWSLLRTAMRHLASAATLADELGVSERHARHLLESKVRSRMPAHHLHTMIRVGDCAETRFGSGSNGNASDDPVSDEVLAALDVDVTADWDQALRTVHEDLVAAGAPATVAADAILGVIDAASSADSKSRMHTAVYRCEQLNGLTHTQRRALAELLIGTRRGGPEESAWLALRRECQGEGSGRTVTPSAFAARVDRFAAPFRNAAADTHRCAVPA